MLIVATTVLVSTVAVFVMTVTLVSDAKWKIFAVITNVTTTVSVKPETGRVNVTCAILEMNAKFTINAVTSIAVLMVPVITKQANACVATAGQGNIAKF